MASEYHPVETLRNRLLGTWRILSWKRRLIASGDESDALGPDPLGYVHYAPDGRVMVFVLRSGRHCPESNPPSAAEKIALFDSMMAYVGSYEVYENRVVHTLDGSWNELWTGTTQTRFLNFEGEKLVYTTPEMLDPMVGSLCTYRVVFEKV